MAAVATSGFLSPGLDRRARRTSVTVLRSETAVFTYEPEAVGAECPTATPTVLAVHGFRGTHHGLLRIVDHLPHVRVIMPDLPGFGESAPLADAAHDIGGYTAWLGALADALG